MMTEDIYPGNTEGYHRFLDIACYEPKAWTFLNLDEEPATMTDVMEKLNRPSALKHHLELKKVYRFLQSIAGAGGGSLAKTTNVTGRKKRSVLAWYLTPLGNFLKPAVAFAMPFLPSNYAVSSRDVLGRMASRYRKRGIYSRAALIRALSLNDTQTISQMSIDTGMKPSEVKEKLDLLSRVGSGNGAHPEGLPFAEAIGDSDEVTKNVYISTGKKFDESDFRYRQGNINSLARVFASSSEGDAFTARALFDGSGYENEVRMHKALSSLGKKGYVTKRKASHYRSYRGTSPCKAYHDRCLVPVGGYIRESEGYTQYVMNRQPSEDALVTAVDVGSLLMRQ